MMSANQSDMTKDDQRIDSSFDIAESFRIIPTHFDSTFLTINFGLGTRPDNRKLGILIKVISLHTLHLVLRKISGQGEKENRKWGMGNQKGRIQEKESWRRIRHKKNTNWKLEWKIHSPPNQVNALMFKKAQSSSTFKTSSLNHESCFKPWMRSRRSYLAVVRLLYSQIGHHRSNATHIGYFGWSDVFSPKSGLPVSRDGTWKQN